MLKQNSTDETEKKKDLFIVSLVHDIKNPLQAQMSCLHQILSDKYGKLNFELKNIVELLLDSSQYMHGLLNLILDAHKYTNSDVILNKIPCNFSYLLQKCANNYQAQLGEKDLVLSIKSDFQNNNCVIDADEKQLRRVVENILSNQIKYAYKNTTISVEVSKKGDYLSCSFENSSPKIDEKIQTKIFDKYKSYSVLDQNISTGLGLYISKIIIEAHKGRIYLISDKESNKFVFELPLK